MNKKVGLPFRLDKSSSTSYTTQLVKALREAIRTGRYHPGDMLPSWEEMASGLGVSMRVPREAMRMLAAEGCVVSRPRIGTVVADSRHAELKEWNAPVLWVMHDVEQTSYAFNVRIDTFQDKLAAKGYPVVRLAIPRKRSGGFDFKALDGMRRFRFSMVVNGCRHTEIKEWCKGFGVPVVCTWNLYEGAMAEMNDAISRFVNHCERKGVRRIMQLSFASPCAINVMPVLKSKGMDVSGWMIPPLEGMSRIEGIRNAAETAFSERLDKGRTWLPDLFFFTDDYLATGALMALTRAGVEIPEDVKVVTLANEGNVPCWRGKHCAAILNHPARFGEILAVDVLGRLSGRPAANGASYAVCAEYVPGCTFP